MATNFRIGVGLGKELVRMLGLEGKQICDIQIGLSADECAKVIVTMDLNQEMLGQIAEAFINTKYRLETQNEPDEPPLATPELMG